MLGIVFLVLLSCRLVLPNLVIVLLVVIFLSCSAEQDKKIRTRNTITNIGRTRQGNQDKKYNHQHTQNKTRKSGQEIQSPK
jgi:hypothetical protein